MSEAQDRPQFDRPKVGVQYGFLYPACWIVLETVSKCSLYPLLKIKSRIASDLYVVVWIMAGVSCLFLASRGAPYLPAIVLLVCAYRYLDIMNVMLSVLIRGFIRHDPSGQGRASSNRTLLLMLINGLEIFVLFAALFICVSSLVPPAGALSVAPLSIVDALYFSVVTATTLGFGDISPVGAVAKGMALTEVLSVFLVFVTVVANVASQRPGIPDLEQESDASSQQHPADRQTASRFAGGCR